MILSSNQTVFYAKTLSFSILMRGNDADARTNLKPKTRIKLDHKFAWSLCISLAIFACLGCGDPVSSLATLRSSSKTLETANGDFSKVTSETLAADQRPLLLQRKNRTLEMSFLHEDHFAVVMIDAVQIYQNPDLQEFKWDRLTRLLERYLGRKNAHPRKLSAVWVLCDREIADAAKAEEAKESDFVVFVVDFLEPFDKKELAKVIKRRSESESDDRADQWRSKVEVRSETQVAVGTSAMLKKLAFADGKGDVALAITKAGPEVDVALSLSFEPVRGALKGVMATATQFLGADMKPLLQLPTSARHFDATLSLTADQLLMTDLKMSSADAAEQVADVWSKLLDSGNIGQLLTLFSFQYGTQKRMFKFQSLPKLNKISRQIEASGLYQVRSEGPQIKSEFTRPRDFGKFLRTAIDDVERTLSLRHRMKLMKDVADVLKVYEGIHGHLPAPNFRHQAKPELPVYSWRAELLPLLGWQRVFDRIDFQSAWNSKVNRRYHGYVLPALHDRRNLEPMSPMLPVNENWMFPDRETPAKLSSITDRRDQTAIALEVRVPREYQFLQPTDLTSDGLSLWGREDEAGVIFIDGEFKVRVVEKTEKNMKAVLTIDGGERLSKSSFIEVLGFSKD